jgi:hypothetical protein
MNQKQACRENPCRPAQDQANKVLLRGLAQLDQLCFNRLDLSLQFLKVKFQASDILFASQIYFLGIVRMASTAAATAASTSARFTTIMVTHSTPPKGLNLVTTCSDYTRMLTILVVFKKNKILI